MNPFEWLIIPFDWWIDLLSSTDNPLVILGAGLGGMVVIGFLGYFAGIVLWLSMIAFGFVLTSPVSVPILLVSVIARCVDAIRTRRNGPAQQPTDFRPPPTMRHRRRTTRRANGSGLFWDPRTGELTER